MSKTPMDTPEQVLRYLDTVMYSGDEDMRRGAYNRVSLHIKQQQAQLASHFTCLHDDATRCRHIGPLLTRIKEQRAELDTANDERDMLAVMGADFDAETTGAGSTPEDWIIEAQRRLVRVGGIAGRRTKEPDHE